MGHLEGELNRRGVHILACAVTATFSQQAFAASLGVGFPLLSDWDAAACSAFGVRYDVWKGHRGVAKRSLFLLDRERSVRYRWVTDDAMALPDLAAVLAAAPAPDPPP